jgi:hypothetical protein
MKKLQNVDLILKKLKQWLDIKTGVELANALKVKPNTVSAWVSRNSLDYELLFTFCSEHGFDLNELIYGEPVTSHNVTNGNLKGNPNGNLSEKTGVFREADVDYLPRLVTVDAAGDDAISIVNTKAAAGYLNGYGDPEYLQILPTISAPGFRGALHRCFEVKGNSMPPNHDGSLAICRYVERLADIRNRYVYVIVSRNDGIVLKRVINIPDEHKLILISDNPNKREFPNYSIDYNDIIEIWLWRGAVIRSIPDPSDFYNRMNEMEARMTLMDEYMQQMRGKLK